MEILLTIIFNFIIYILMITIIIFLGKIGENKKMNDNKYNYKDFMLFIENVNKQSYSNEEILDKLNHLLNNMEYEFTKELREYALSENCLILKLHNFYKNEHKYYLFKNKEFKFLILAFKNFDNSKISNKVANLIFEDLKFSIEEINSFKKYLDIYLNKENEYFFSIFFSIGYNFISPYMLESKYTEIQYETTKEKFITYEKNMQNKVKETEILIDEKIKETEKNFLSIIGAFIGVFTLISINATFLKESSDIVNPLLKLVTVNIITTLGIALLIFLVSPKIKNKIKISFVVLYILIMSIIFTFFYYNHNKNEIKKTKPIQINTTIKTN